MKPYVLLVPFVAFALLAQVTHAQTPPASASPTVPATTESAKAGELLAHARQLYSEEGARVALPEFEKALVLFREQRDRKSEAITLGLIGNCYKKFGEHAKALDYLTRALVMKREVGDRLEEGKTLSHLGLLYWQLGQYPLAIEQLNQAIAIGSQLKESTLEASARNNLGLVYDELGEYRRSLEEYEDALELYRGSNFERGIADTVGNIGGTHLLLGEFSDALGYYEQALASDKRNNLKPGITLDLQNIALCYLGLGRVNEALLTFDRSIELATNAGLNKEAADSRKGKASALVQMGKYTAALEEYDKVLRDYEQANLKQSLIEGLGDLGNLDLRVGDVASAEKNFHRALELSRAIKHPRGVTVNLLALGDLEWRRKRFKEAAEQYREALARANEIEDKATAANAHIQLASCLREMGQLSAAGTEAAAGLKIARSTQARLLEIEALYGLGQIATASTRYAEALVSLESAREIVASTVSPEMSWRIDFARAQTLERLNRDADALAAYQSAVRTIEEVRSELREDRFRAGYIEDKYQVYIALVELLLKLERVGEAFGISERLRARGFLDLLERGQPPISSESQREKEATLRSRIRRLQNQIEEESSKPRPEQRRQAKDLFSHDLTEAENDYQNFLADLLGSEPAYASIRALTVPSTLEVQRQIPVGSALIEYVVGEENLMVFVVTTDGLYAKSVPIRASDLQVKVEFLRDLILRKNTNEWELPASSLYQSLIEPVRAAGWLRNVTSLYVVPHAILHYVPFGVLRSAKPGKVLIDDYTLAYLPAAAILVSGHNHHGSSVSALAMAPANTRLTYSQQESRDVSTFFPRQHKLIVGRLATESSFKRLAGQYDVIHLATHGFFNKLNPLLSGVMLEPDTTEDGRMEVHEILRLKLNANLVTLSACDSALGSGYFADVPSGDDLVGLTRAFLFAGTPSVLASLWEVNDRSAGFLMHSFYGNLGRVDKATALARAQRDMHVRHGRYAHPYYWGTFVLVGEIN